MSEPSIIDWNLWSQTPSGQYILQWEQRQLDTMVADIFGYHALQFSMPQVSTLRENRIPYQALVLDTHPDTSLTAVPIANIAPENRIHSRFDELPFSSQSIDLAVLPHVLETSVAPHAVLRELERVLVPEGQLILSGFNHLSLWGARHLSSRLIHSHFLPQNSQLIAFSRIKDWLKLLGFEIHQGRFGCYCPPYRSQTWLERTTFMEKAGDRWWPIFGAVYMITAIKRVRGMRLLGPAWKHKMLKHSGLTPAASPTTSPSALPPAAHEHSPSN